MYEMHIFNTFCFIFTIFNYFGKNKVQLNIAEFAVNLSLFNASYQSMKVSFEAVNKYFDIFSSDPISSHLSLSGS